MGAHDSGTDAPGVGFPESLASPTATKEVLARFGLAPSKALGQHFMIDGNILAKIVEAARLESGDVIVEVGPGIGTLTRELAARAARVVALELDAALLPVLESTLSGASNVEIIRTDAVRYDLAGAERLGLPSGPSPDRPNKLVSNLPYNIAGPLLARYLTEFHFLERYVVMIQKEVADRILAGPGSKTYGSLSVRAAYHCRVSRVCPVPRTVFLPRPHVDSAVILLERRARPAVRVDDETAFFRVVRAAFGHRRKILRNALSDGLGIAPREVEGALSRSGVDPKRRGETLSLEEFAAVSREIGDVSPAGTRLGVAPEDDTADDII